MYRFLLLLSITNLLPLTLASTELQSLCIGANQTYLGTSCYVFHKTPAVTYSRAKIACQDYLGYYGHLYHIRNVVIKNATHLFIMAVNGAGSVWNGFEQYDSSGARTAGWGLADINGTVTPVTYVPWGWNGASWEPIGVVTQTRAPYSTGFFGLNDAPGEGFTYPFVCEYEEANKHSITPLEKSCSLLSRYHVFADGKCYVMHPELLVYSAAKAACTDVPHYNGYLAHPRTNAHLNILSNFMLAAGAVANIYIGVEQTNATAADSKTVGWFFTSPTKSGEQATFLPWNPTEPDGGTGSNNVIYIGASQTYSDVNAAVARAFVCEYEDKLIYNLNVSSKISSLTSPFNQIDQSSNVTMAKCVRNCRINGICSSFAYSSSTSTCQLLAVSSSGGNFSFTSDFKVYARQYP